MAIKKYFAILILSIVCCIAQAFAHNTKPALIPMPQKLSWGKGYFNLRYCNTIVCNDNSILKQAKHLQNVLAAKGVKTFIVEKIPAKKLFIQLVLDKKLTNSESYTLDITNKKIFITASTPHGIFNGLQTLQQLVDQNLLINTCEISDSPAFAVRGFMIDAGRNYQSIPLIKQQIDIMAKYKFNVLHFHATEDIAWRFESKIYPQLTAAENMIRNKGAFYAEAELKELMQYCKSRFITFIPEIDMPGHSAAFKRAMGFDMQSEQGLAAIKKILVEFIDTYQPEYLHIGGDEVKITNKNFLPEVIALVESQGVKTIGWSPGGNIDAQTIRQLWMEEKTAIAEGKFQFIDSRHLYLNHMDPFEGVATLFNRQIGNKDHGDSSMLGAILCNWPDRRVENEVDAIKQNLVYPGMLAFAERAWKGGGTKGWVANIGSPGEARSKAFTEFENRLLLHKSLYFKELSFPYVKQQNIVWNLLGPYNNGGDLEKKFNPELSADISALAPYKKEIGATVVLRHWWYPLIKGAIDSVAKENSTWYATTRIWSDKAATKDFWISFYNPSRSQATDTPPAGAWDYKQSRVWINGKIIDPPSWKRVGEKGDMEIPFYDESYEYRAPTKIVLRKGWNEVLIKAPVGSFKGINWNNPVKWMFTFVQVN